jgi:hypothetical protein
MSRHTGRVADGGLLNNFDRPWVMDSRPVLHPPPIFLDPRIARTH